MSALIEAVDVVKAYRPLLGRAQKALQGLDLQVSSGEVFGLIGPNGAGKTTFMTCLLGLQRPDRGRILVDGRAPDDLAIRARTGYLPERLGFDRDLTGRQFLMLHARLAGLGSAAARRATDDAAHRAELPEGALRHRLRTYSRGMLQRIGLAQAFLGQPDILFLDEPTSALDPTGIALLRDQVLQARARGATVILNSHQLHEVERVCDRVAFIDHGRVTRTDSLQAPAAERRLWRVRVGAGQAEQARTVLERHGLIPGLAADGSLTVQATDQERDGIAPALVAGGLTLSELSPDGPRLEELFVRREVGNA